MDKAGSYASLCMASGFLFAGLLRYYGLLSFPLGMLMCIVTSLEPSALSIEQVSVFDANAHRLRWMASHWMLSRYRSLRSSSLAHPLPASRDFPQRGQRVLAPPPGELAPKATEGVHLPRSGCPAQGTRLKAQGYDSDRQHAKPSAHQLDKLKYWQKSAINNMNIY